MDIYVNVNIISNNENTREMIDIFIKFKQLYAIFTIVVVNLLYAK